MAELLFYGGNNTNPELTSEEDEARMWKRGNCVGVFEDGHEYGALEVWPHFAKIKFPGAPVSAIEKYIGPRLGPADPVTGARPLLRRSKWQVVWAELPLAARTKFQDDGEIIVRVLAYAPDLVTFDYTWAQVRSYFLNHETALRETEEL
jgi:hypothetical protein